MIRPLAFWYCVDKSAGEDKCWPWTGQTSGGYGICGREGAHRIAYRFEHGNIPKGMLVRHSCDNPICVNPAHLLMGTVQDNTNDMLERQRHASQPNNRMKSFTRQDIIDFCLLYKDGATKKSLMSRFNLTPLQTDSLIKKNFRVC